MTRTGERVAEPAHSNGSCDVTAAPRIVRRRFAALVLAALLLPAGLLQVPAAPEARAQASGSRTVDVAIDSMTPSVPSGGDTLTVSGSLTNKSDSRVTGAHVALRVRGPLTSRSEISQAAQQSGYSSSTVDGVEIGGRGTREVDSLAPGISEKFRLSIPVNELPLDEAGVHQLAVSVTGVSQASGYEQVLGIEHTFLPWHPGTQDARTQLTFVWPLVAPPQITARTQPDEAQTPVFSSDALLREMEPGGRLQQQLLLAEDLPVTWVIDPDLLAAADAMTRKYRVTTEDGKRVAGKGQDTAKEWLAQLQEAVKNREVVGLPFADTDLASIAHRGRQFPGSLDQLKDAATLGKRTVRSVLHVEPVTDIAWPAAGAIDPRIVKVAGAGGAKRILARSDSLQDALTYTPTAARPVGGGRTAVVADAQLSQLFRGDMSRAENHTLSVQEFLAQTLMISLQQPSKQRSIVVAPQRTPTASQAQSMAAVIEDLEQNPWMAPLNLSDAADAEPDPDANRAVPGSGEYPGNLRRQEIPVSAFQRIEDTQRKLAGFSVILTDSRRVIVPFGNALLRELSTQWRGRKAEAQRFREGVQDYLEDITQEVQLIEKSDLTLSGNSGTIPVTVQNNLVQDVRGLKLRLTSDHPNRLGIKEDEQIIEVSGGHSASVKFEALGRANGPVNITAQLYTADNEPFGDPKTFEVEVTSITPTVLLVIGVGILLLVLAGLRMYTQRKKAGGQETGGPAPDGPDGRGPAEGGSEGDGTGGDGAGGDGGDGGDDTGHESGARSRASERVDR